jgi:hypothetical protein
MIDRQQARYYRKDAARVTACLAQGILLSACLLLPNTACLAQDLSKAGAKSARPGAALFRLLKRSDADAGVQLLDTIISRVMNSPQVAVIKSTSQLAQNVKQQNSPTDYKLAIRPKESGKVFSPAPKSPLVIAQGPGTGDSVYSGGQSGLPRPHAAVPIADTSSELAYGDESTTESWKGSSYSRIALKNEAGPPPAAKPGFWENRGNNQIASAPVDAQMQPAPAARALPRAGFTSYSGNYSAPANFNLSNAGARVGHSYVGGGGGGGLPPTNMGKYVRSRADGLAEEPRKTVPDLATAVGRLYKVTKTFEEADRLAAAPAAPAPAAFDKVKTGSNSRDYGGIYDSKLSVKDMREPSAGAYLSAPEAKKEVSAADAEAGSSSDLLRRLQQNAGQKASQKAKEKRAAEPEFERKERSAAVASENKSLRRDKLALLPPNVATGIPGLNLNLGSTEFQAVQAIAQSGGKLKQHKIRNWTVYSWTKRASDTSDALQLYFRHGLLDAIRIFDPDLISSGFGVSPGDSLEVVKERFGEPAFLLPEPNPEAVGRNEASGKNYIYPISQVGFQLARPTSEFPPQVVSVLIFSLK